MPQSIHSDSISTTPAKRWGFLAVISLGLFMVGADNSILYTALPTLRHELGPSEVQALWIINAYPLVLASLLLGTGTLGDKIGHRRMFEIGLIFFGLSSLAAAFAPTPAYLIAARAFLGAGAATMMPATLALLRLTFSDIKERNTAIGVWGSVATLGAASGPIMGGFLLEHFWWGSAFLVNIPVVVIAFLATFALAPKNIADPSRHWDAPSSLWAGLTMASAVVIIKDLAHNADLTVLLPASIVLIGSGYLFHQRQGSLSEPVIAWGIFANPVLSAGVLGAGIAMFIISGTELTTTQRAQLVLGFSPLEAGLLTAAAAAAAVPTSVIGGAFLHRIGFRPLIAGGFGVMSLGLLTMVLSLTKLLGDRDFAILVLGLVFVGLGGGLVMSVTSTAIIGSAPKRRLGMASAVEEVSYEFGTLLAVAVLGSLFPLFFSLAFGEGGREAYAHIISGDTSPLASLIALDQAYQGVLSVALIVAMGTGIITYILLRGNPKETLYAHE
ncbi:MFS transporter [Corynebacterium sp. ES2794-CONJ1]|uniref:MFS transporter n=1 Tax=unclassified Corynebacterium TaxID=2624378 RepID=UPI0021694052|nr:MULTISPECIES: MFS transporter [unclassified Corynebacterium]MCS4490285.1 MFS transporter [Corynebacterium sp. ES2775-CONJ]MCS4491904.1 MFS transporter [Corynebacterium sp. ES2715-CONJ3]MCU9519410.1 MFS transporter [Corynebacterium sp. ES2794-CONJ1]